MAYVFQCNSCGKKLFSYEANQRIYKSPLCTCKHCGTSYIDPRCQELAVTGIPEQELKPVRSIIFCFLGLVIGWRGYYLFGMRTLGLPENMQWLLPTALSLLGGAMLVAGLIDLIRILTGAKKKKLEKMLEESKLRMQDEAYVAKLKQLGYLL